MPQKHSSKFKFYAVRNGRTQGIFLKWVLAGKSVNKYKSCNHQGFYDILEAEKYLQCAGLKNIMVHSDEGSIPLDEYKSKNNIKAVQDVVYTSKGSFPVEEFMPDRLDSNTKNSSRPAKEDLLEYDLDDTGVKVIDKSAEREINPPACPTTRKSLPAHMSNDTKLDSPNSLIDQCLMCQDPAGEHYLECTTCKFKIHFQCSPLPAYQITNTTSNRRKYRYQVQYFSIYLVF